MAFIAEILIWYVLLFLTTKFAGKEGLITYIVSAAIIANIETTQFIHVFGMEMPGGIIPFACLFLATDISSELYGRMFSRKMVQYSGFGMMLSSLIIALFGMNEGVSQSYHDALGATFRIAFASISVYFICGMLDVRIYHFFGKRVKYKWLRNNLGTITAQFVNAFLFIIFAFGWIGLDPIMGNWIISVGLALIDTPMVYIITGRDRLLEDHL